MARWSLISVVFLSFLLLNLCTPGVNGHAPHAPRHGSHHHAAHAAFQRRNSTATAGDGTHMTLDDARELVAQFQQAMAQANAANQQNPRANNYTIYNKTDVEAAAKPAPYLEYSSNSTAAKKRRRAVWRRQVSNNTAATNSPTLSYTIPPEVAEAARTLAEANPPDTSSEEYDAIVARMKQQYAPKNNNTNVMPQVLQRPSGLLGIVDALPDANSNATAAAHSSASSKRASTDFWIEKMAQLGSSPSAPAGYKVNTHALPSFQTAR